MRGPVHEGAGVKRVLLALLVVCAAVGASTVGVAAESDDEGLFSMTVSDDSSALERLGAWVSGLEAPDPGAWIRDIRDQEPTPEEETGDLQTFVNANNESFVNHTNEVFDHYGANVSNTTYVLELTVENVEGDTTDRDTVRVVATADGSNVTSLSVADSTNETVDRTHTLGWNKAEDLNEDIRSYHENYVETGEVPSKAYIVRMASKYNVAEIEVKKSG